MKKFHLADGFAGDVGRLIVTRMLIQASSGAGKSWALRRLLEETHGAVQHLVIDPEGEFFTLREKFDYVLAARQGGDTSAEPRIAGLLAERLLEIGASAILDLYDLPLDQRKVFVKAFLEAVIDAPRKLWHPTIIVVDEAHVFCPEKGMGDAESAPAVKDLCTRGRKRGFAAVLATQRLAKLSKDAAAECTNKLIGRTNLDVDVKRALDELGFGKERWQELKTLGDGDFFAFGPALTNEVRRIHVGPVRTTHPKVGTQLAAAPPPPTDRIKALLPKLSDLPAEQERKAKTEADLRTEIRSLKGQLAARPTATVEKPVDKRIEVQVLEEKLVRRLEKAVLEHASLQLRVLNASEPVQSAIKEPQRTIAAATNQPAPPPPRAPIPFRAPAPAARTGTTPFERDFLHAAGVRESNGHLPRAERRILAALAQFGHPKSVRNVAVVTGYAWKGGGFTNAVSALRVAGFIRNVGLGLIEATQIGVEALGDFEPLPTGAALAGHWQAQLPKAEREILRVLCARHPESVTREELASVAGYAPDGGGFNNALSKLRVLELIEGRGELRASDMLFDSA